MGSGVRLVEPALAEHQAAVGGEAARPDDGLVPAQRDVRRREVIAHETPLAEADDRLDQVGRDRAAQAGASSGFGSGCGCGTGSGASAGSSTGSTTIVFEGPLRVIPITVLRGRAGPQERG